MPSAARARDVGSHLIEPAVTARPALRLDSLDQLRGLVIVLMALDHTRDFFHAGAYHAQNPLDVSQTSVVLYLTRWVTHLCAPTFVLLAGVGAFMRGHRSGAQPTRAAKAELSRFLVTRGLWLVVLELTFVAWAGWFMAFAPGRYNLQVIWALGASMILLGAVIWLPRWAIAALGVAIVALHNLTDGWAPEDAGALAPVWRLLHVPGTISELTSIRVRLTYPVLPWLGVMLLGYTLGPIAMAAPEVRRRWLVRLGIGALVAFAVLRGLNLYGNPTPWQAQDGRLRSLGAMFNVTKYPPSLNYVLATLGISMLLWRWFDGGAPRALRWLSVFGAVPMFVYLLHLPLIHGLAAAVHQVVRGDGGWLIGARYLANGGGAIGGRLAEAADWPAERGFSLAIVYLVWISVIAALYPLARWFAGVKRRRRDWWWLSYL
jgi:uncharacterized membrane protein